MHPPHQPKRNESGRKIAPNFGEDLFFFFLILGEKIVGISDFGRKIALNFGEDIRIIEVLCLKSHPPPKFSGSATGCDLYSNKYGTYFPIAQLRIFFPKCAGLFQTQNFIHHFKEQVFNHTLPKNVVISWYWA